MDEKQIYEALGVKEQEPAAPAPEKNENHPPSADETTNDTHGTGEKSEESDHSADVGDENHPPPADGTLFEKEGKELTPEQRRENAAQRRRQEQQAAIEDAVKQARAAERESYSKELETFFATAQLKNPITGAPIKSMEEFREWRQSFEASRLENDLKSGKLTPESLNSVISENPVIKRAEELIRKGEEEQQRQSMAAAQARVDAELAEIQKLDPNIKSVGDLLNMPNVQQFREYVNRGNSFIDAFYLANRERLQAQTASAAKQQAINNARSKDHLTATSSRGGGAVSVPSDELAMFKALNPKATEAEIQAYYNKTKKN